MVVSTIDFGDAPCESFIIYKDYLLCVQYFFDLGQICVYELENFTSVFNITVVDLNVEYF